MLRVLTKRLRAQSLSEPWPGSAKVTCSSSDEDETQDSEDENQELALIDKEHRRCGGTGVAQAVHHQWEFRAVSRTSSAPERPGCEDDPERPPAAAAVAAPAPFTDRCGCGTVQRPQSLPEKRKRAPVDICSSDDEVKALCVDAGTGGCGSGAIFGPLPPQAEQDPGCEHPSAFRPIQQNEQDGACDAVRGGGRSQQTLHHQQQQQYLSPCKRLRPGWEQAARPSLDLEKMQQKMAWRRQWGHGARTRILKFRCSGACSRRDSGWSTSTTHMSVMCASSSNAREPDKPLSVPAWRAPSCSPSEALTRHRGVPDDHHHHVTFLSCCARCI
ncbi:uncharacterized protein LOC144937183 isoform X2 [Lampetra fluviatilis]